MNYHIVLLPIIGDSPLIKAMNNFFKNLVSNIELLLLNISKPMDKLKSPKCDIKLVEEKSWSDKGATGRRDPKYFMGISLHALIIHKRNSLSFDVWSKCHDSCRARRNLLEKTSS